MKNNLKRLGLLFLLLTGIAIAILYRDAIDIEQVETWINEAGIVAPLVFMLIYVVATVFFLPGSVLTLMGGALFGPVLGTFYSLTGATIGATFAFLIARYLAADAVEQRAGGLMKRLINGVEAEGWRFVAFVRLVPLFPFNLLNYALGLTRIRLMHYVIASYLFMLPGGFAYTWLGYAGKEALSGGEDVVQKSIIALALLGMVAFLPRLISTIRRGPTIDIPELEKRIEGGETLVLDVRTAEDYIGEQGHIEGSLNIAVEDLPDRADEIDSYRSRPIAIVCTTDRRSAKASNILSAKGFDDVNVVRGGMTAWLEAGLPVERN